MHGANHPKTTQSGLLSSQWLGPAVVGLAFIIGAALSWRKWPDVLIDFGLQLYLPWKISSGSVLYRDVMYLTGGPLSQYYNAGLFRVFGVSLTTLILSNLVLTCVLLVIVYRGFRAADDTWTATTICLGIVMAFAFAQYGDIGNYNFITPYCHEVFHGLVLSIAAIALLTKWNATARTRFVAAAGFCAGLVFLTKPEVFAALALSSAGAFILFHLNRREAGLSWKSLAAFSLGGLLPCLGFLVYFHHFEGWRAGLRSVLFAWLPLLESSVSKGFYYRWCLGLDAPFYHFRLMLAHFLAVAGIVAVYAFLLKRKLAANRLLPLLIIAPLLALASRFDWTDCGRALPLLTLALCVILIAKYRRLPSEAPPVFPLLWGLFALGLLAKLGLFCRIWHYGFALAMPAFAGAIYLLLWLVPLLLEKYGVHRFLFRIGVGLVLMLGFVFLFTQSELRYGRKTVSVGQHGDRMFAFDLKTNPAATAVQIALEWLSTNAPPEATLAVLPEGVMVNYLSRRTNPTRYCVWNPAEEEVFGQDNMTAAFIKGDPDFVMLVQRDASEYGVKPFGQESRFGLDLMRWIERNYEPVWLIGHQPLQADGQFGIKILRRLPVSSPVSPAKPVIR